MEILRGKQYKSKVSIGDAPVGTTFRLRSCSPAINDNNVAVFQYDMCSVNKIKGSTIGYSDEFLTEDELHTDFMEMFEDV